MFTYNNLLKLCFVRQTTAGFSVYINIISVSFSSSLRSEAMFWLIGMYRLFFVCLCKDAVDSQGLLDSDNARNIVFLVPVSNHTLAGHVIANKTVESQEECQMECFLIGDCVSLNFDTRPHASPNCQLSASDRNMHSGDFKPMSGYIYQGSKNGCLENAGTSCEKKKNTRCQSGFGRSGFRCICKKCFHGDDCQTCTKDTVLHFYKHSIDQHAVLYKTIHNLENYTVSLWLQTNYGTVISPTVFSIVGDDNKDQLALYFEEQSLILGFSSKARYYNATKIYDGRWHNIAFSWSMSKNQVKMFIDKEMKYQEKELAYSFSQRKGKLRFALGQEQDNYNTGDYSVEQSFKGNITGLNMWDREFSEEEIQKLATECFPDLKGNLFDWASIVNKRSDALRYFCGLTCKDLNISGTAPTRKQSCFDNQ